jgi:hypothetical protein
MEDKLFILQFDFFSTDGPSSEVIHLSPNDKGIYKRNYIDKNYLFNIKKSGFYYLWAILANQRRKSAITFL